MKINWHIEKRKVKDLIPHPKNPRIITEKNLKMLKESFDEIGYAQPINISLNNVILSGHARHQQLVKDQVDEIEVLVPDRELSNKEEEAVIIRMNKNIVGEWDFLKMEQFDKLDLLDWGFDKKSLGIFDEIDIDSDIEKIDKLQKEILIMIECETELEQQKLYDELKERNLKVRVL